MSSITLSEFHLFHSTDRHVFSRLVITLKRQATQSLLIMALWLWLEDANKCKIISKLTSLSNNILDTIANEASLCINYLKSKTPTLHGGTLNHMTSIMGKNINMKTLLETKYTTISGVKAYLSDVCAWCFTDILLQVLPTPSNLNPNTPLKIPGFPHPTFGTLEIYPLPLTSRKPTESPRGWAFKFEALVDDRTLFLTFSRGFPVTEEEAKQFFVKMCGDDDCIESFEMEVVTEMNKQSLYATMVLSSVIFMDQIMCGKYMAKFKSNGKHIWARKFERRDRIRL
ncbi:hypothetical protein RND81_05G142000 [Saponaria officinalis]|uniref:Uncharacterized protein n=1 Tax=Saponaria officinalis TaxID=3572 RepID=A0AAW1KT15_SAPOF